MKFCCFYAYDVPFYANFTVEAPTREDAERQIQNALIAGNFSHVTGEPDFECTGNDRVSVMDVARDEHDCWPTLGKITETSPSVAITPCPRCGRQDCDCEPFQRLPSGAVIP